MTPTISIIIPVYNTELYIQRCLNSIQAQVFTDYEVILVDDGSSDSTPAILDNYVKEDKRFRVYHEKNRGSSLARKFGMSKAVGEWYVFIDSDDDVHPEYLSALYHAVTSTKTEIACCDMQKVGNNSNPSIEILQTTQTLESNQLFDRFFHYDFWGFGAKIYNKSVFENIYFPKYNINEDYVVMAQLFSHQKKVSYIPNKLYYYRTNPNGQSYVKLTPRIMDEYYNKKWVADYFENTMPNYKCQAKAQLIETCIKLISIISKEDTKRLYNSEKRTLKKYLLSNILFTLFRSKLLLGLKVMALRRIIQ